MNNITGTRLCVTTRISRASPITVIVTVIQVLPPEAHPVTTTDIAHRSRSDSRGRPPQERCTSSTDGGCRIWSRTLTATTMFRLLRAFSPANRVSSGRTSILSTGSDSFLKAKRANKTVFVCFYTTHSHPPRLTLRLRGRVVAGQVRLWFQSARWFHLTWSAAPACVRRAVKGLVADVTADGLVVAGVTCDAAAASTSMLSLARAAILPAYPQHTCPTSLNMCGMTAPDQPL